MEGEDPLAGEDLTTADSGAALAGHREIMALGRPASAPAPWRDAPAPAPVDAGSAALDARDARERHGGVAVAERPRPPAPPREAAPELTDPAPEPSWWTLLVAVGGVLVFFAITLFAPDWGDAAGQVALLADALAVLCLGSALWAVVSGLWDAVRGRRAKHHPLIWLGFAVFFAVMGLYELPAAVVPLHLLQAREAEAAGRYDQAYRELLLAGLAPCDAPVTNAQLHWAAEAEGQGRYDLATAQLQRLMRTCPTAPDATAARQQLGAVELHWGEQLETTGEYAGAIAQFQAVQDGYASSPLAAAAHLDAAATYTAWGSDLEHEGRYADALARYQTVLQRYADTEYATTARAGAAQTLYDWGQWATRQGRYDEAVQHYDQLVTLYPDLPQAAQASALLLAPQQVVGRLTHNDGAAAAGVTVRLASEWQFGGGGYASGGDRYTATSDATGIFTLGAVPPGRYLLEWTGADGRYTTFIGSDGQPVEIVVVPQLHPLTLGNVDVDPSDP
jgi:tetratricopeptide (TPR) repeat protein